MQRGIMAACRKTTVFFLACVAAALPLGQNRAALAGGQTWTCNFEAAAGLKWNGRRWDKAGFTTGQSFTLTVQGAIVSAESAAVPLSSSASFVRCPADTTAVLYCFDASGGWLVFDPKTGHGGVSKIYTAIKQPPNPGSTLSVAPFSCTSQ